jgi:hypothetical protein
MQFRHLADSSGQDVSAMPGMNTMTMLLRAAPEKLRDSPRGKVIGGADGGAVVTCAARPGRRWWRR